MLGGWSHAVFNSVLVFVVLSAIEASSIVVNQISEDIVDAQTSGAVLTATEAGTLQAGLGKAG